MNDWNHDNLDERQRLAQEAVRSLGRPQADPDFRARLKAQFVAGTIPATATDEAPAVDDGTRDAVEHPAAPRDRRPWALWGGLAAAAVVAFVMIASWRLPGPELMAAAGSGSVTVDGVPYPADDPGALGDALAPGARIVVPEGMQVDVAYPGSFFMRLEGGTEMVLPARPGRWTGRGVEAVLAVGELSVRTGPDLAGGSLTVDSPEARTVIRGTLVSVFSNGELSCICLVEGHAEVLADGRPLGPLTPGKRWVVFADGREPQFLDIAPPHLEHMKAFDATLR